MPFKSFLPHSEPYFDYFASAAKNAYETSEALYDLLCNFEHVSEKAKHIHELEQKGDDINHTILNALSRSFIAPFDRQDVQSLSSRIDNFVDHIYAVARRFHLYGIRNIYPEAVTLGRVIRDQGHIIYRSIPLLEKVRDHDEVQRNIVLIHDLENEADAILDEALAKVFEGAQTLEDVANGLRWQELYGLLEDTTDQAEDVANVMETLIIKD